MAEEEAKKAGPKAVEITKKFEQAYIDRDYDAMLEMLTDDIKAALPFRCAPRRALDTPGTPSPSPSRPGGGRTTDSTASASRAPPAGPPRRDGTSTSRSAKVRFIQPRGAAPLRAANTGAPARRVPSDPH